MKIRIFIIVVFSLEMLSNCGPSKNTQAVTMNTKENVLTEILNKYSSLYFDSILQRKDELKVQIIYTQVDRDKDNHPLFRDFYFNVDDSNYYYPASTVKLPIAVLALQKLNELHVTGLDKNSIMITGTDGDGQTGVEVDSTAENVKPSIANYIKKILLVSDNNAFNRLYEFLGQEYINNTLHQMGYEDIQIIHRLDISLAEQQNRHTNPVRFYDAEGKLIYEKPPEKSQLVYAKRITQIGKGYMKGDSIVYEPLDFSKKNRMCLRDLHQIVRSVIFPQAVPTKQRFNLTDADYDFLHRYMSMTPPESKFPSYDTSFHETYVKFLFYGADKAAWQPDIRSFNKPGDAYGFLIDAAYIADFKHNIEFMVSAVIYCNSDGILNDDKYDYATVGLPFMKHLGEVIYEYEVRRKKQYMPDLSSVRFDYR